MCDDCNCKVKEYLSDPLSADCYLKQCAYTGAEKECDCEGCEHLCTCSCHTDYEPDGMTKAKEMKYGYY